MFAGHIKAEQRPRVYSFELHVPRAHAAKAHAAGAQPMASECVSLRVLRSQVMCAVQLTSGPTPDEQVFLRSQCP